MLNQTYQYNGIIKKAITVFGKLFSDITIQRTDSLGAVSQTINVPLAYAAKEKYLVRVDSDPNLANNTQITLPRLSFEITGYTYDPIRKPNKMNKISCYSAGNMKSMFTPVPYNLDISLYLLTKTIEDALTVVEQILPIFTPDYTMSINAVPDMNIVNDVPIILNSVSVEDDYEGSFTERRSIIHTFNFTMKINIFGHKDIGKAITKVMTNVGEDPTFVNTKADYVAVGNLVDESITSESWTEHL